jgi:transposase
MKRKRRTFSKEFKITLMREIENGAKQAEVCRKYDIHPVLVSQWRRIYDKYPDTAFSGKGNLYKEDARIAELERLVGKLYAENDFLKKALSTLEKRARVEKEKMERRSDI